MRWDDFRRSDNVEDDRDNEGGGGIGGGGFGIPIGRGGLGIGTIVVLGVIGWALGIDPSVLIGGAEILSGGGSQYQQTAPQPAPRAGTPRDRTGQFVAAVLGNTEDVWTEIFRANGRQYRAGAAAALPRRRAGRLRLRASGDGAVLLSARQAHLSRHVVLQPRCSSASTAAAARPANSREAYVIAHEVGHHVQDLLGVLPKAQSAAARRRQQGGGKRHPGAHRAAGRLLRRGLGATAPTSAGNRSSRATSRRRCRRRRRSATIVCRSSRSGYVVPDSFTHGTSAQRQRWFTTGCKEGKVSSLRYLRCGVSYRKARACPASTTPDNSCR